MPTSIPHTELASRPRSTTHIRTLLVEDDEYMAEALRAALERHGHAVTWCVDAQQAIEQLRSGALPALIVLDLWTPNMDGWEFRVAQRREPAWVDIPVVAMSGDRSAKAEAIDAQAFLAKPVTEAELLETVDRVLGLRNAPPRARPPQSDMRNGLDFALESLAGLRRHCRTLGRETSGMGRARARAMLGFVEQAQRALRGIVDSVDASIVHTRAEGPGAAAPGEAPELRAHESIDVRHVLQAAVKVVEPELPGGIRISYDGAFSAFAVADPRKLELVLHNLLRNSAEALSGQTAPELKVTLRAGHDGALWISIRDTGRNIALEDHERIFDPFYTTSTHPHVTGLGLTVARRLMQEMGGVLEVASAPGFGATFRLGLRLAPVPLEPSQTSKKTHILLVNDDAATRNELQSSLATKFAVTVLGSGQALGHLGYGAKYDLVLCDGATFRTGVVPFLAAVALNKPEQAARCVLLHDRGLASHIKSALTDAGVWHIERTVEPHQLPALVERLLRLWSDLGLRH